MSKLKTLLCRCSPRYKLRCILRACELEARPWQIQYALGLSHRMDMRRQSGKTVAVILRMLMSYPEIPLTLNVFYWFDPDYTKLTHSARDWFYYHEYNKYYARCIEAGIPVPVLLDPRRPTESSAGCPQQKKEI